ncbi:hypothetical protein [Rubripirellula amarantea]|uniref:hypothetical protein n=1 Tax=Rubripirellula amarantea TaxID=2527999 RepID=UPI0013EF580E|nr:hypothetical protein [Rubripirellula amarantea]
MRPALTKGGIALALTQFLPLVQVLAGLLAMFCCIKLGIADDYSDDHPAGRLPSALAGFVCTAIVALVLSGLSLAIGFLISRHESDSGSPKLPA